MVRKVTGGGVSPEPSGAGIWCSSTSKMRQTFGWVTRRAMCTSRWKRSRAFARPARSVRMVLRATVPWSLRSLASYTSPMPPCAMKRTIS